MVRGCDDQRTAILIVRVWTEASRPALRARITQVLDLRSPGELVSTASTVQEIQAAVTRWLDRFLAG